MAEQVEVADIVRMTSGTFGINQAKERSPEGQDQGDQQEESKSYEPLFFNDAHGRGTSLVSLYNEWQRVGRDIG